MPFKKTLERTPWWLVTIIIIALVLLWNMVAEQSYQRIANALSEGLLTTVGVTFMAFILASLIGLLIALAGFSRHRILREFAQKW